MDHAQNADIAAASEEGRPHAAAAFQLGYDHLNRLRRIAPRAQDEWGRLQTIVARARPGMTPESLQVLDGPPLANPVPAQLRAAGQRSAVLGSWAETLHFDALASEIEALEAQPSMAPVVAMRGKLGRLSKMQTNVEIARWLAMALAPGDTVVTNGGERLW